MNTAQTIATIFCIALGAIGATMAIIGAIREGSASSPGEGIVLIVVGGVLLGIGGIVISIAAKLLGMH